MLNVKYNRVIKGRGKSPGKDNKMKKYDLGNIMRNAWNIRRSAGVSMSVALKAAWALEKAMMAAEELSRQIDWNTRVRVSDWSKGGCNRTYVSVVEYTNAWNRKREHKLGYVDNLTGAFVAA